MTEAATKTETETETEIKTETETETETEMETETETETEAEAGRNEKIGKTVRDSESVTEMDDDGGEIASIGTQFGEDTRSNIQEVQAQTTGTRGRMVIEEQIRVGRMLSRRVWRRVWKKGGTGNKRIQTRRESIRDSRGEQREHVTLVSQRAQATFAPPPLAAAVLPRSEETWSGSWLS